MIEAAQSVKASLILGLGFITIAAALFVGFSRFWAGLYTNDHAVVVAAMPIFLLCGLIQFGDAGSIILEGSLVGVGDTRSPLIANFVWSWFIGMPLSYWLTFHQNLSLPGLWSGRVLSSLGTAVTLFIVWQRRLGTISTERVSVIMPFYRAGKYIDEAIQSVFAQEYDDWRLYLIDDESDDVDSAAAERWSKQHPGKVRVLKQRHRGTSAARNLGIKHSKGEMIAFLDADDTWYRHNLRSQVAKLDANPEADMTYGPALRWRSWNGGGTDEYIPATVDGYGTDCLVPGSALLATYLRSEALTPCPGSVMVRRSALERVAGFEEQFPGVYDDQVLYAKLCIDGQIYVSSDCVSRYRKHSESCCARAETNGEGMAERARFLNWLQSACHVGPVLPDRSSALQRD